MNAMAPPFGPHDKLLVTNLNKVFWPESNQSDQERDIDAAMKKRLLISAGIVAACGGAILAALALLPPRPGVTKANFDRLEKGMTIEEVEAIFNFEPDQDNLTRMQGQRVWINEHEGLAVVTFNTDGKVVELRWSARPPLGRFAHLIHWPWW
jgi:hypothetical protein